MKRLQIEATKKSPSVDLNPETCTALFKGRSIHSDAFIFYEDIVDWFDSNCDKMDHLKVDLAFDHINTVTNKCILQILLILGKNIKNGKEISVVWSYDEDDDDMLETGEELELLSQIKFEYKTM